MRYALYLLPDPATSLWKVASAFIGYDSLAGAALAQPVLAGIGAPVLTKATEDPRRYGFHLTLKAPFRLAPEHRETALLDALKAFCRTRAPFALSALELEARLGGTGTGFVCLAQQDVCPTLLTLEADSVRGFDAFRAPLNAQEIARRKPERLTDRQRAHLDAWGYPFVLDEFRPHFSLTGEVENPETWCPVLASFFAQQSVELSCTINGIGLFRQDTPEARFKLLTFERFSGEAR